MKVTYNWLRDFVEIEISPQALAEKLTMAGLEVTSLEKREDDWVFEIEVTANRADCLSVIGIAREVVAITGKKLSGYRVIGLSGLNRLTGKPANRLTINIQDKKACPLYTARLIANVKIKPSPEWMQKRLQLVDLRPINNIVDITNYVLMETGQPLHAFDLDKIAQKSASAQVHKLEISIRRAKDGEEIVSIDGEKRILDKDILVIATEKPIAIAGIMGGLETEVSNETKNILLESAYFDPITIRRAWRKLGVSTESSYRFERGVDLQGVEFASRRAAGLICNLTGASLVGYKSVPQDIKAKAQSFALDTKRVNHLLGTEIKTPRLKNILTNLGFSHKPKGKEKIQVSIPSFRQDIKQEADLIEEVARIFGYENIPTTLSSIKPQVLKAKNYQLTKMIRDTLINLGLNEVITFSLINHNLLNKINLEPTEQIVAIENPLSKDQEILRPTLLPSMLECITGNLKHNIKDLQLFEISHIFSAHNGVKEQINISLALTGAKPSSWQDKTQRAFDFFDLKGIIGALLNKLGIKDYSFVQYRYPYFDTQISVNLVKNETVLAVLGKVNDVVLGKWDIANKDISIAQIYLDKLSHFINLSKHYLPLNNFPPISRNLSIVVPGGVSFRQIEDCIKKNASALLQEIKLVEEYRGEHIEKDFLGISLLLVYQAKERTLTDEEVNTLHKKTCQALSEELKVKAR